MKKELRHSSFVYYCVHEQLQGLFSATWLVKFSSHNNALWDDARCGIEARHMKRGCFVTLEFGFTTLIHATAGKFALR